VSQKPFRPSSKGVGWEPATMTGWAITVVFVLACCLPFVIPGWAYSAWGVVGFLGYVVCLTAGFLVLVSRLSSKDGG
jgi:hypothetical protein